MDETRIEQQLVKTVKAKGGLCPKWTSPGMAGVPDRIILLPGGNIAFAELKASGKKPLPLQLMRKKQLESLGFKVYIIDSKEQIGGVLDEIQAT